MGKRAFTSKFSLIQVLTVGVEGALPVPSVVEVDLVDGEVAHVVQAGAPRPVQADHLVVPTVLPSLRAELIATPPVSPLTFPGNRMNDL